MYYFQDVPLAHELRPSLLLKQTMDHLLCNVVDRIDCIGSSMVGWYDAVTSGEVILIPILCLSHIV